MCRLCMLLDKQWIMNILSHRNSYKLSLGVLYLRHKKDNYQLIQKVPVKAQKASIDVSQLPSSFYKVVIELPHNVLNRWVLLEK